VHPSRGISNEITMPKKEQTTNLPHKLPADFSRAINSDPKVKKLWKEITPLARNEWICWVISVKQEATREKHIAVGLSKMRGGMRRPCCWLGCTHRKDKAISPSVQWALDRRSKK